jgi:phosphate butyryltransferase
MNFEDAMKQNSKELRRLAVAAAHDAEVLEAVFAAEEKGMAHSILVGDEAKIRAICAQNGHDVSKVQIIDEPDVNRAAAAAARLVRDGKADFLMKGMLQTAELLRAVLDKENGLRAGSMLSHVAIFQAPGMDRLLFLTDGGMVMYPDIKQKAELIRNSVVVARALGVEVPKVAALAAIEIINPDMQATLDAAVLTQMNRRGQIKDCIVDGPLALDNAIDILAAEHKGVKGSDVAGHADILLVPNIEAGNMVYKCATKIAHCKVAGMVVGAKAPIVLTSRADSAESKLASIAFAAKVAAFLKG